MPRDKRSLQRARRHRNRAVRRGRATAVLVGLGVILLVMLVVTAFGSSEQTLAPTTISSPSHLLPLGPPRPQIVALRGALRIQMPVAQGRVTAIGYHGAGDGALALEPVGRRGNRGFVSRLFHRLFGGGGEGLTYYQLPGSGPPTSALDVGAAAGTAVYAPVDGTVVSISPYVIDGRRYGSRLEIQPSSAPAVVVSVTQLVAAPALVVGAPVVAARTKIGTVADLARVETQALARYTHDAGNHVSLVVRPAAPLTLP